MTIRDARGDAVTGASTKAIELYDKALGELQLYVGDPLATIDTAIAENPDFVMAHCLRAYLHIAATEAAAMPEAARCLQAIAGLPANDRENRHRLAVARFVEGNMEGAVEALEDVLVEHPRDALALQTAHLFDFFLGDARNLRDRVARVLPCWSASMPGYHAVLGMHAFGLEETGAYGEAEAQGRKAVELNSRDAWAIHAVAHVMEMQGRRRDGIDWMTTRESDWATDNFFAVHNWWHLALYHLDLGDIDRVLALYDARIRDGRSQVVMDMLDASSMLWRLNLAGIDVGDRWAELADCWEPLAGDAFYAFNDAHAMMSFVGDGRDAAARTVLAAQRRRIGQGGSNDAMTREVGLPVCEAIYAFGRGDHGRTVELLRSVRSKAHRFGGSNAQRDVLSLTLIEAASRDGQHAQVRALANERIVANPTSPLGQLYRSRAAEAGRTVVQAA